MFQNYNISCFAYNCPEISLTISYTKIKHTNLSKEQIKLFMDTALFPDFQIILQQ